MKLICALILWQVLLQVSKEDTVPAETNQIDKQSEDIESKNIQIQILKEEVIGLMRELQSKNDQLKNSQEIETALLTKLGSKNKHIQYLEEIENKQMDEMDLLYRKIHSMSENLENCEKKLKVDSKNKEINDLQEIMIELQRELESKYDPVGKCSMPTVRGELSRQHRIMEKLEKNLNEKQNNIINELNKKIISKTENLESCDKELKSEKNTIDQLKANIKELTDKIEDKNAKSWIAKCSSGLQSVTLSTGFTFKVLCNSDIAGPGWIVIQQRIDGKVDFYRNWDTYRDGFGDFWDGSFFLGLEKIHQLTAEQPHELYIHMERFDNSTFYARYDEFAIAGEDDQYRLNKLGDFCCSAEYDELWWHKNKKFTTYDRDNDLNDADNCAEQRHGAWWYRDCATSNLNGRYFPTKVYNKESIFWGKNTSLKQVKMMIRPKVT